MNEDQWWESHKDLLYSCLQKGFSKFFPDVPCILNENELLIGAEFCIVVCEIEVPSIGGPRKIFGFELQAMKYFGGSDIEPPGIDVVSLDTGRSECEIASKAIQAWFRYCVVEPYYENLGIEIDNEF